MPFASLEGRQLHYTDTGGDQPALIFLHTYTTNGSMWDGMIARFAPMFRCIAPDLPGHGRSEPSDLPKGIGSLAEDIVRLLDHLQIERAHVCGLSIGGMIGQHLGFDYATRMRSLVLACTSAAIPSAAQIVWEERLEVLRTKGLWAQVGETVERWYGAGLLESFGPADLDPIGRMIASTSLAGALTCGEAVKQHDTRSRLGDILAPTLVIGGDLDQSFAPEHAKALADGISGAKLVMIPGAGHLAPVQQPDAFDAAMRAFFEGQTWQGAGRTATAQQVTIEG